MNGASASSSSSSGALLPGSPVMISRKPRTLVLCFDGTANEYDADNTNVIKFYSLLRKDKVEDQLCYYQAGIGTYFQPGVVSPVFQWCAKILDEAIAWYLPEHVMDGYKFLMQNYNVGDKVCLFGFSRGAYTARALAGMLHKVGLLSKDNEQQVPFAYKLYKSSKTSDLALADGFKATFCRDVPIEFLGVWDTVASVGVVMTKTLPFVSTNTTIKTFRHALALDEHRAKFRPSLYHRPTPDVSSKGIASRAQTIFTAIKNDVKTMEKHIQDDSQKLKERLNEALDVCDGEGDSGPTPDEKFTTDVKEIWFVGCHSDVGGGDVADTEQYSVANIPLRWMVREVMQAQCGMIFENAAFQRWNIPITVEDAFIPKPPPAGQTTLHDFTHENGAGKEFIENGNGNGKQASPTESKFKEEVTPPPTEGTRQAEDGVQPIHDELKRKPLWWLLEIIPTKYAWQDAKTNNWVSKWSFHLGRGRFVPANPKFHESVKIRMDNASLKYTPRARYQKGTETYTS